MEDFFNKGWQMIYDSFSRVNARGKEQGERSSSESDLGFGCNEESGFAWDESPLEVQMIEPRDEKCDPEQSYQIDGLEYPISDRDAQRIRKPISIGRRISIRNKRQSRRNSAASSRTQERA